MDTSSEPCKCEACGHVNRDSGVPKCEACGHVRRYRISFVAPGGKAISFGIDTSVGRNTMRRLGEAETVYVDVVQFHLRRNPDGNWFLYSEPAAKNPTWLNGVPLDEGTLLEEGMIVSFAGRLPLKVEMIPEG